MLIGAVADDMTGATDLGLMLSRSGMRTVQLIGLPDPSTPLPDADAVVIALKSRTIPPDQAVAQALAAGRRLLAAGAGQLMFKYCSTFDSTDAGNIGPVIAALLDLTGARITIACPAYPANGRTVYQGHLFLGQQLLSDSPMQNHPLTPMRDANLVRVLSRQTRLKVGLIDHATITQGAAATLAAMQMAAQAGTRILITDCTTDADLMTLGSACRGMALVTGGSGIAAGLAANFAPSLSRQPDATTMAAPPGRAVILAGSCSAATLAQIDAARTAGLPVCTLDVTTLGRGGQVAAVADWAIDQTSDLPPLICSSADPRTLARIHSQLGRDASGTLVEQAHADIARRLQAAGFSRFIVAGGETSGAVVKALGVTMLNIGPEIDPGVPWTRSIGGPDLALALKSGNFGTADFFVKAWSQLELDPA